MTPAIHKDKKWPVFLCYRRTDGRRSAEQLFRLLHGKQVELEGRESVEPDVFLDSEMPAVADWRRFHGEALQASRALVLVCSPGARPDLGVHDWVYTCGFASRASRGLRPRFLGRLAESQARSVAAGALAICSGLLCLG